MPIALLLLVIFATAPILPLVAIFYFWYARRKATKLANQANLTGKQVAEQILAAHDLTNVPVNTAKDAVGDHYDPKSREIALTTDVRDKASLFGMAVAAHEVGHALQQKEGYRYFQWWIAVAPYAHIGTFLLQVIVIGIGFFFPPILFLLVIVYSVMFLMSLLSLPNEYDASRRALAELDKLGLFKTAEERKVAKTVLIAAGLTYVAKALQDLFLAIYWALRTSRR